MKLTLITPGPTTGSRDAVFGDAGDLLEPVAVVMRPRTVLHCAPEPACRQLAVNTGTEPVVLDELRGPDFGSWHGLALQQVMESDLPGLQRWLTDPTAAPHGGESLAAHLDRIGALLDAGDWPERGATLVAPALTVRAACVHALGGRPDSLLHLDIAPGTTARISLTRGTWRLQAIVPPVRP